MRGLAGSWKAWTRHLCQHRHDEKQTVQSKGVPGVYGQMISCQFVVRWRGKKGEGEWKLGRRPKAEENSWDRHLPTLLFIQISVMRRTWTRIKKTAESYVLASRADIVSVRKARNGGSSVGRTPPPCRLRTTDERAPACSFNRTLTHQSSVSSVPGLLSMFGISVGCTPSLTAGGCKLIIRLPLD